MAPRREFADRADAGRRLARALPRLKGDVLVLGLARGGMPVAAEVARAAGADLDVLVVRKVGHPQQPEYALGAVSEDGLVLPPGLPEPAVESALEVTRRRAGTLRGTRSRLPIAGRTVVVVDDGLATGRTMAVALHSVAAHEAGRVVMAVPVGAGPGVRDLGASWEVCAAVVAEPPDFVAVGQYYDDFDQVDDAAVTALLGGAELREAP